MLPLKTGSWCWIKSRAQFDNDTLFVFGHAFDPEKVTGNKADIKAMQDYLKNLLAFVNSQIKEGKTKEEIHESYIHTRRYGMAGRWN